MASRLFPSILPSDDDSEADGESETPPEELLDDGVCPWCPSEEADDFDNVGSHAAQVHPKKYDEVR